MSWRIGELVIGDSEHRIRQLTDSPSRQFERQSRSKSRVGLVIGSSLRLFERFFEALRQRVAARLLRARPTAGRWLRAAPPPPPGCAARRSARACSPRSGSLCDTTRPRLGSMTSVAWQQGQVTSISDLSRAICLPPNPQDYHSVVTHGPTSLRIATYNIHRCRGLDGRTRPDRIIAVLRSIDADVIALAGSRRRRPARRGPRRGDRRRARHGLGHGVGAPAARPPVRQRRAQPVSRSPSTSSTTCRGRRASRGGCSASTSSVNGSTLHVYNVHLGTAILERRHQAERLADDRDRSARARAPKLVLGDFNEWMKGLTTTTAERAAEQRRPAELSDAAAHLSRRLPDPAPRPHLLRRPAGDRRHRAAAHAAVAGRVGSFAAGRRCQGGMTGGSALSKAGLKSCATC